MEQNKIRSDMKSSRSALTKWEVSRGGWEVDEFDCVVERLVVLARRIQECVYEGHRVCRKKSETRLGEMGGRLLRTSRPGRVKVSPEKPPLRLNLESGFGGGRGEGKSGRKLKKLEYVPDRSLKISTTTWKPVLIPGGPARAGNEVGFLRVQTGSDFRPGILGEGWGLQCCGGS